MIRSLSMQKDVKKPDEMILEVKYSGFKPPSYLRVKEDATIGDLRKAIKEDVQFEVILRHRIDLQDGSFKLLYKSDLLPISTTRKLEKCGIKKMQDVKPIYVCDPVAFKIKVTYEAITREIEIACYQTVEKLKSAIEKEFRIKPCLQRVSYTLGDQVTQLVEGERLVEHKIMGEIREDGKRVTVHNIPGLEVDDRVTELLVQKIESTAASGSKSSKAAASGSKSSKAAASGSKSGKAATSKRRY